MTSRERVSQALNFQKPDRVPIDLGGMRASGIAAVAYDKLKKRIDLNTPTKITDSMQILAEVEASIDFPEEDLDFWDSIELSKRTRTVLIQLEDLLQTAEDGKILREGLSLAIVGKPNVGKSSLLNELLQEEKEFFSGIRTRRELGEIIEIANREDSYEKKAQRFLDLIKE